MLKNKKFKELAGQYIDKYELNLSSYNVLAPIIEQEPCLAGLIASMAKAENVYMFDPNTNINRNLEATSDETSFNGKFIGSLSSEILSSLNIILKNSSIHLKEDKLSFFAKQKAVISLFPKNLDFLNTQDINMEALNKEKLFLIGINPEDAQVGLYQHISHIIVKKCHNLGLDIFKSKMLIVGNGTLLNNTLSMLKSLGAVVYAYNTTSDADQSYILKRLKEIDALIIMDYPQTGKQMAGSKGVISICDLVDQSSFLKILHICGETETGSLKLGSISYFPENIVQDTLNLELKDLGERGITELVVASLKIAENFLTLGKNSLNSNKSVVTYNVLKKPSSLNVEKKDLTAYSRDSGVF